MDYYDSTDYSDQEYGPCDFDSLLRFEPTEINKVLSCCKQTRLHHSLLYGLIEETVQLMDKGADVNIKDKSGQTALHIAVADKSISPHVVNIITEKCLDINNKDKRGRTALHLAISCANYEAVKVILQIGADINAQDCVGNAPLHYASCHCLDIVKKLVKHGANVELKNNKGKTPLHIALGTAKAFRSLRKLLKTIKILIDNGANINVQTCDGKTPLHVAGSHYYKSKYKAWRFLLKNGAKVHLQDVEGTTPLHLAAMFNVLSINEEILATESGQAATNVPNNEGKYPLHIATEQGNLKMMKLLLDNGALVDSKNKNNETPLHLVTTGYCVSKPIIILLIKRGASLNVQDVNGMTPLHNAVKYLRTEIMLLLLENGAEVNIKNKYTETPLQIATGRGNSPLLFGNIQKQEEACKTLLANGAEPKVQDDMGNTPLHNAVKHHMADTVKLLLERGAYANSKNKKEETPLHIATCQKIERIICEILCLDNSQGVICLALLTNGASPNFKDSNGMTPLHNAVKINRLDLVKLLIENGADVNSKNEKGETPLHTLTRIVHGYYNSWEGTCTALLANGATPNLQDNNGMTPLHNAVERGCIEIVNLLLDNGADVNSKDKKGKTPLHIITLQRRDSLEIFNLLLQKGARVNEQDKCGRTALHNVSICVNKCHANKFMPDSFILRDFSSKFLKLLEWGGLQNIRDNFGKIPSDYNSFTNTQKKYDIKKACLYSTSNESRDVVKPSLQRLQKYYFEEIECMKLEVFGNHSLYDIFHHFADPIILSNLELKSAVQSMDLEVKFPFYGSLLKSTYRSSRERVQLLDSVPDILQLPLPFEVTRYLLTFVDNNSLRSVIRAKEECLIEEKSDATSASETESDLESDWKVNLAWDYESEDFDYEEDSYDSDVYDDFN